jgi:peptidoglycan/xylan/chitin deacetylase (PgdA/CDA1 family)
VPDVIGWAHEGEALPPRSVMITFDDGYADLAEFAFPVLRDAGFSATVFVVTGLLGGTSAWDEPVGGGAHRLLDAAAIAIWSKQGIEFGAHTRSHANLARLPAPRVEEEVVGSRADLEAVVGGPVYAFAYPWGAADERARAVVTSQFPIAFDRVGGMNFDGANPHRLRRSMVLPSDVALDISLRVRLGFSPRQHARARIAGARRRLLRDSAATGGHAW